MPLDSRSDWADRRPHPQPCFAPGRLVRHVASLHRDAFVGVWLLCWTRRNDTGWHDHDLSAGAVAVVQGALVESNPRIGGHHRKTVVSAGTSFHFGADHLHRLTGASDDAISVHVYSPPLWRLGQYDLSADGILSAQLDPLPR